MNIFYLDRNPAECAKLHCDKHVVKMILEYAQLLSTAHNMIDGESDKRYKTTHKNHPSAVWVRQSIEHYGYVKDLLNALGDEYEHRYGKVHKTIATVSPYLQLPPKGMRMDSGWVEPPQCMPDHCKQSNAIKGYMVYYKTEKAYMATWKSRKVPDFMA